MPVQTTIKLRRGTAAQWTAANPVLAAGEMGIETDTNRSKYGNGTTAWNSLSYSVGDSSGIGTIDWTSVLNKPATFPPSAHTHSIDDITDYVDLGYGDVDGGNASAWYSWLDLKIDNSNASVTFLDGVYVDGGNSGSF